MSRFDPLRLVRPEVLRTEEYRPPREGARPPEVRLSANENPLGPSPRAIRAGREAVEGAHRYPDPTCGRLKRAFGDRWGLEPERLLVENGLDGALALLASAFFAPGDEVILPDPTFPVYEGVARLAGARPIRVPCDGEGRPDGAALIRARSGRTKAVFLPSPNNPTGGVPSSAELAALLDAFPEALVIVDEAYREFCDDPEVPEAVAWVRDRPNLVAMRTFSKAYGLAGVRVGILAADPGVIGLMSRIRQPYSVNGPAQAMAEAALADEEHLARTRAVVRQGRERLEAFFRGWGIPFFPSRANFLTACLGEATGALCGALLSEGILVRDLAAAGLPGAVRITVGSPEETSRILEALERALPGR